MAVIRKIKALIPTKRKLMQLYFALLFNANFKGFSTGRIYQGGSKSVCVPGINCYSCPGAVGACPLGSFQGSFSADRSTLFYVGGILLLYCILFGRMICGWLCPFGLIQELLYKIKVPKLKKNPVTRVLSYLKYVILVFFVFIVPILYALRDTPLPAFCKYICPAGTIEGGLALLSNKANDSYFEMLGPLFTWKFLLMISIVVGSLFIFRLFCRFLCPLGALYGLFNKLSVFGVKVEESKCTHCNLCVSHCKLDILHVSDQECIACGECIDVCPTKAISWKGPKIFLKPNETSNDRNIMKKRKQLQRITRAVIAVVMIAVLIGAVIFYWNESSIPTAEVGSEIGDKCASMELQLIDATGILENTLDPSATGKVTVINFWGTWCTPCVNELPYFDQIAQEYKDSVTVIAVHSYLSVDTAPEYIQKYYNSSPICFAADLPLDNNPLSGQYYTALGGTGAYPYTVILDEYGIIQAIFPSSVEYDDLKEAVSPLLD